jgi:hypothetical protein
MAKFCTVGMLCLLTLAELQPLAAPEAGARQQAGQAIINANVVGLLSSARDALHKLDHPPEGDGAGQPRIYFDAATESLTTLYQVYGCDWAAEPLRALYARADAPALRVGYSADGRILLRVEPLDLQNPAFSDYTILLCTLTSETARDIPSDSAARLAIGLPDGNTLTAQAVDEQHPLWPQLTRMQPQFAPPKSLPSGAGIAFKQVFAQPRGRLPLNECAVSLAWGGYGFDLPRWTAQEAAHGRN